MGGMAGAVSGFTSILASLAIVSEVGGMMGAACFGFGGGSASFAAATRAAGVAASRLADAACAAAGGPVAGAAVAGPCEASAAGDGNAGGFCGCWKATSIT